MLRCAQHDEGHSDPFALLHFFTKAYLLGSANGIHTALMARMRIAPEDRWQVKAACLKQLLGLPINATQRAMLSTFVSIYLPLNAQQTEQFAAEVATWQPQEKEDAVDMMTEWERVTLERGIRKGKRKGKREGKRELITQLITYRYGPLPETVQQAITQLNPDQILDLSKALLDFVTLDEVEAWLAEHAATTLD
ncbi:MAG: DUF4351 domain-containing protein [Candidatus Viridilinea halotolerans]|uniref:DUF4351 domain-containing protein n=1 Tax=Candidatus Viridilinea halotolerans TaxID=2491704 RepID=A0A426TVZ3_9CHLR|nr:MAG: DUF4351 domain-containing protein [Candidatus Viridilinea halotolerans]